MRHHAFVIEANMEKGVGIAERWLSSELKMESKGNSDVVVLRYGLLSVSDARRIADIAAQAPFEGQYKALIITAGRAYHEAQNALLKIFEEPPRGTYLFLVLPTLGGLLPTLRSRVVLLTSSERLPADAISEMAQKFIESSREKRSTMIKKLTSGKDEDDRRARRDEAIEIVNGIEVAAYAALRVKKYKASVELLSEISELRSHLYDRSAPVRMILEHLAIVVPKDLSVHT
ncbi:MAG: hypothetical protein Q7J45_01225 [bacterium]|nr:hypothetical protein [bacterium]